MLQTNHFSKSNNGEKKGRRSAKFIIIMCYQSCGTERGDVTCHVRRDRTLLIGVNSKPSKFPASTGRGESTKLQAFITFWPTAWHYALHFVQQEISLFRIPTTGTKIRLSTPQELEYIFIKINLFVRDVFTKRTYRDMGRPYFKLRPLRALTKKVSAYKHSVRSRLDVLTRKTFEVSNSLSENQLIHNSPHES